MAIVNEPDAHQALKLLLRELPIRGFAQNTSQSLTDIYPEEQKDLPTQAVPKRQHDFATGRFCARIALEQWGVQNFPIRMGHEGTPIWPLGYLGSITHTTQFTAALVTPQENYLGIGLDAESLQGALHPSLGFRVSYAEEREYLARFSEISPHAAIKLLFSARESFYKTVFPLTGRRFDYKDVKIDIDWHEGTLEVRLANEKDSFFQGRRSLSGRFLVTPEHVITLCWLKS